MNKILVYLSFIDTLSVEKMTTRLVHRILPIGVVLHRYISGLSDKSFRHSFYATM